MRGRSVWWMLALTVTLAGIAGTMSCNKRGHSVKQGTAVSAPAAGQEDSEIVNAIPDPPLPRLPETQPPAGLPIVAWGKRGYFPVIRQPQYLTAEQGDRALARDEPVLGLVIGKEARAYSTNQLNDHEMVVDTIADTPVLVSY
jgi:hypothetical protein